MEVEICSDSADDSSIASGSEASSGRRSQRIRKPSLCNASEDYSTPPKKKKTEPKSEDLSIEEIYKQLGTVKAKSTSLETIYEQPKNFKDPSRNLMAGIKTRRSCVLAEFYYPSKFKLKARKERAKRLKRLGVKVPTGDLISEAELQAALAVISEDEDDLVSNKTSHNVNTSLILVSPKRDVYLPSPEVSLVAGSSFIVPDQSFIEENLDVSKEISPDDLYKISLPFLDEPCERVDGERSRSRKTRRSGGLKDFHSSTLSFRREAAVLTPRDPGNDGNSSIADNPVELLPTFQERISAIFEKEEQDESPVADGEEESTLGNSSSCRKSPMNIGLPSSPKNYSLKHSSSPSKSPNDILWSPPLRSAVNNRKSPTIAKRNLASSCSPKGSKTSPKLFKSSPRSKSPGAKDSCVSCKSSIKRSMPSPPTRTSRYSKALKRVSSPPPPCPVCTDCNITNVTPNKPRVGVTKNATLNSPTKTENTTKNRNMQTARATKSLRSNGNQTNTGRGKQPVPKRRSPTESSAVTSKEIKASIGSRKLNSTSSKKSDTKRRRVSGVMKTLYSSYFVHSSPEEDNKSKSREENLMNSSATNELEGVCVEEYTKLGLKEQNEMKYMDERRNNPLEDIKSVVSNQGATADNVHCESSITYCMNTRKRKLGDHLPISPLTSQMGNLDVNDGVEQTLSTADTKTPLTSIFSSTKGYRKTLGVTAISLNTTIQSITPNIKSIPTTLSPTCHMAQLSLSSPINQRNTKRANHRRRSARLQAYTLMPLDGLSEEEQMEEVQKAAPVTHQIPPCNLSEKTDEKKDVAGDKTEEDGDSEISFKAADERDDEEREISFKMHDSSGELETELTSGDQQVLNSSIPISLASVEDNAPCPTVQKRKTRRSAVFTKDSFLPIEEEPVEASKSTSTILQTKAIELPKNRRHNKVLPNNSHLSVMEINSSKHPMTVSSKPKRVFSLKSGTNNEVVSSPPVTRARVIRKASKNTAQNKAGSNTCFKSTSANGIKAKRMAVNSEIIGRPIVKVNKSNFSTTKALPVESSSIKNNVDIEMEMTDHASSVDRVEEFDIKGVTLLRKSSLINVEENALFPSVTQTLDNNNEKDKDVEMKLDVAFSDENELETQLDGSEFLVTLAAVANSDPITSPPKPNTTEEICGKKTGFEQLSQSAPPSPAKGSTVSSLSPPDNPAVLVPAALPSPAETKKAFYLINKYKPRFSLTSHPSLGLNYNDASANVMGNSSDVQAKGNSADDKKNVQKKKSSSFASGGGGRTCFAVHPALASCTKDVFAGRKMVFVPDKKSDELDKTSAQAAFVSAVSKKLNNVDLESKPVSKEAGVKVFNSKDKKSPASKGTKGISPKTGTVAKGRNIVSTKSGRSPKGVKNQSPKKVVGSKGNKGRSPEDNKVKNFKRSKTVLAKNTKNPSVKGGKGVAARNCPSSPTPPPPPAAAAASSSGSSNASPKLSRSPFGGKGKTKIMLNDLADQEAIFDSPSPTIERKDYVRTGLGGSSVCSLSPGSLLLKPGNAFSPPTLKPAQHIFPSTSPKSFSFPRSLSSGGISSTISNTLVASNLAAVSLPPASKLHVASFKGPKTVVASHLPTSRITKADSVPSQGSVAVATIPRVIAPTAAPIASSLTNGHCPTATPQQVVQARHLESSTSSFSGIPSVTGLFGDKHTSDVSKPTPFTTDQPNPLVHQVHVTTNQERAVISPSYLACKDPERRPDTSNPGSVPAKATSSIGPVPTNLAAITTLPVTPSHHQPPASVTPIPAPSSSLKPPTTASDVLSLNSDSPLLSGMFNNTVGVRVGKVFANRKTVTPHTISEPKKLLPSFSIYHH